MPEPKCPRCGDESACYPEEVYCVECATTGWDNPDQILWREQIELPMVDPGWYWPSQAALNTTLACVVNGVTPSWTKWYNAYYDSMVVMRSVGLAYSE